MAKNNPPPTSKALSLKKTPIFKKGVLSKPILVVSTKVSKSSVKRNYIKRQLKEELKEKGLQGSPLFIVVHPPAIHLKGKELKDELRKLLDK